MKELTTCFYRNAHLGGGLECCLCSALLDGRIFLRWIETTPRFLETHQFER